jgi:hypothetical protein
MFGKIFIQIRIRYEDSEINETVGYSGTFATEKDSEAI